MSSMDNLTFKKNRIVCGAGAVRALRVDLKRSILSPAFFLTIGLLFAWLAANSLDYLTQDYFSFLSYSEVLNRATTNSFNGFAHLLLILAGVPYAWSYCRDKESGFLEQAVERTGIRAYGAARVVAVAVTAFVAAAAAIGVFTAAFSSRFQGEASPGIAYLTLASQGGLALYLPIRIIITGLTASMAAVFGLLVTVYIPNIYMAFLTPLMSYYFYEIVFLTLWKLKLFTIPRGLHLGQVMFAQPLENETVSFFLSAAELFAFTVLFGILFCRKLRKEQEG